MNVAETTGRKRDVPGGVSKSSWIKRATLGSEVVSNFMEIVDSTNVTIPMIKQQLIMHGVEFNANATKAKLKTIIASINPRTWSDEVE